MGNDPSGFRIVTVKDGKFESHYYGLGYMPPTIDFEAEPEPRATLRKLGSGRHLAAGALNAITDVGGVAVGQTTLTAATMCERASRPSCRTRATCSSRRWPGRGVRRERFRQAGRIDAGGTNLAKSKRRFVLTSTLNVPRVADAVLDYMLALPATNRSSPSIRW